MIGFAWIPPGGRKGGQMTTVIDHVEGHYETNSMSYGQAFVWCPECVVVECECGETVIVTASESMCRCGIDHEVLVRETMAFGSQQYETLHPWEREYREWLERQEEYLRSEEIYQQEWNDID
jgi:hypothetical protein